MAKSKYPTLMTDGAYSALALDVEDPDVWIEEALAGKVNNSLKRHLGEATEAAIQANEVPDVDPVKRVQDAIAAGRIKTRIERAAEAEATP